MKTMFKNLVLSGMLLILPMMMFGQQPDIGYFRTPDQKGLHVFETFAADTVPYDGFRVRVGGNFTLQMQMLSHSNEANVREVQGTNVNALYPLSSGFNLATANLNFDVQLNDGIRMSLESYMSSRHHPEFWVKGGYIQFDKLPMLDNPQWFEDYVSVRVGHMMFNYGDQHFRRSDNGRTFYNPFVGNYIMDAFTTEIGGEVYVFPSSKYFMMLGVSGGLIAGDVRDYGETDKSPSVIAKVGFDDQVSDDLRFRLTASMYTNPGTTRNTLYAGDRAGSRYYLAMEPEFFQNFRAGGIIQSSDAANRFTSGRLTPDFTHQVTSLIVQPFVKYRGLEFFGAYEVSTGTHNANADDRRATQFAGEVVYRFARNEQFYVGARYNQVNAELSGPNGDVSVDRFQLALGWFTTQNMLVKLEYVNQSFRDFDSNDYRYGGEFSGLMIEAAIAF